jgi:hypothetical protein
MKVGGSFSQVFDYLRRLELLDRLVVIDSLQLAGGSGTSGASRIDADIKGRMFSAAATAGAPGSAAKAPAVNPVAVNPVAVNPVAVNPVAVNPVTTGVAADGAGSSPSTAAALPKAGG